MYFREKNTYFIGRNTYFTEKNRLRERLFTFCTSRPIFKQRRQHFRQISKNQVGAQFARRFARDF